CAGEHVIFAARDDAAFDGTATRRPALRSFPGSRHFPFDPGAVLRGPLDLATPDTYFLLTGLLFIRVILGEQPGFGEGKARANEPLREVLISDQARAQIAPGVITAGNPARHGPPPHALPERRSRSHTATPATIARNRAALLRIWRLDPFEPDFGAIDAQYVARDGFCPAGYGSAEETRRSGGGHQLVRSLPDHPS